MDNTNVIKQDVRPILTSIQKIRYTSASKFFVNGMGNYVRDYIKNIKQMVDTSDVQKHYNKHYTSAAKHYVERYNNLKDDQEKQKRKVIVPLLIIAGSGYIFYKIIKKIHDAFQVQLKAYNNFRSDIYSLAQLKEKDILETSPQWMRNVFGFSIDIVGKLGSFLMNVPSMIGGLFRAVGWLINWLFNQQGLFQDIIINTALVCYNVSFQTSWGVIIGKLLKRARLRTSKAARAKGWQKFGTQFHLELVTMKKQLVGLYQSYYGGTFRVAWQSHSLYGSLSGGAARQFVDDESNLFTQAVNSRMKIQKPGSIFYHTMDLGVSISPANVSNTVSYTTHGGKLWSDKNDAMNWQKPATLKQRGEIDLSSSLSFPQNATVAGYLDGTKVQTVLIKNFPDLVARIREIDNYQKKYGGKGNQIADKLIEKRKKSELLWKDLGVEKWLESSSLKRNTTRIIYDLLLEWKIFQYKLNLIIRKSYGFRYHSRFETSQADITYDSVLNMAFASFQNTRYISDLLHRYNNGNIGFSLLMNRFCDYIDKKILDEKYLKIQNVITRADLLKWQEQFQIDVIERKLLDIKKLFNALYYKNTYGLSSANVLYYNDQVSDANVERLVTEVWDGMEENKKQGTIDTKGIINNKSSLQLKVWQIMKAYVQLKVCINELREKRKNLIYEYVILLLVLQKYANIYKKRVKGWDGNDTNSGRNKYRHSLGLFTTSLK